MEKTYIEDFLEKNPEADRDEVISDECVLSSYDQAEGDCINYANCEKHWQEPMKTK